MKNRKDYTQREIEFIKIRVEGNTINNCAVLLERKVSTMAQWSSKFKDEIKEGKRLGFDNLILPLRKEAKRMKNKRQAKSKHEVKDQMKLFETTTIDAETIISIKEEVTETKLLLMNEINDLKSKVDAVLDYIKEREEFEFTKPAMPKEVNLKDPVLYSSKPKTHDESNGNHTAEAFEEKDNEIINESIINTSIKFTAELKREIKERFEDGVIEEELARIYKVELDDIYDIIDDDHDYFVTGASELEVEEL